MSDLGAVAGQQRAKARGWGWVQAGPPRFLSAALVAAVLAVGGLLLFEAGERSGRAVIAQTGTVYRGGTSATISTPGWEYSLTSGTEWIDSDGGVHSGSGWPSCVRNGPSMKIQFGSVDVTYHGVLTRVVVWVRC